MKNPAKIMALILSGALVGAAVFFASNGGKDGLALVSTPEATVSTSTSTSTESSATSTEWNSTTTPPVNNPPANNPPPGGTVSSKEISWGDRAKKQVIFTFDGGAGDHSGDEILATLSKYGINSTFFVTGKFAVNYPLLLARTSSAGHEVFNHTYNHPDLTKLSNDAIRAEFRQAQEAIMKVTGKTTKPYFRPPYGARDLRVREVAAQEGYQSIYWTVDALDWKPGITDDEVKQRVMQNLNPGTIYMFHIGDDITGRVLEELILAIRAEGYAINSLTEGL